MFIPRYRSKMKQISKDQLYDYHMGFVELDCYKEYEYVLNFLKIHNFTKEIIEGFEKHIEFAFNQCFISKKFRKGREELFFKNILRGKSYNEN